MAIADVDRNDRTDDELTCPVRGCDYTHESAQGLAAHVGNGHPDGWDATDAAPADVHRAGTARDESASRKVAKVQAYLARKGVTTDAVRVYFHGGDGNVQMVLEDHLGDEWPAFKDATDVDGIQYVGGDRSYCTDEFVSQLPEPEVSGVCETSACRNTETLTAVVDGGETLTLCRACRKEFWGVSS